SRLNCNSGRILALTASASLATPENSLLCAIAVCCGSLQFPLASRTRDSSSAPFAAPADGVPEGSSPFSNLGCRHVALWKEVAAQAISDLPSIDTVILLFCCRDRPQHEGMSD